MTISQIVGSKFYRIGDSGTVVMAMQLRLRDIGYPLKGTGYWANATDTAFRAFQKRAGLKVDGVLGATTAGALDAALGPQPVLATKAETAIAKAEIARPLWLQAGLALVGTREGVGAKDNQTIIDWAKDEGGDIAKEYTHDSIPWCALFAGHCLTLATLPGTETLWALDFAGKWPSKQLAGPAVGAFAPMLRNGGGHIIIVVGKAKNGNVVGLGGNQGDAVSLAEFAPSRLNKGFWWPGSVPMPSVVGFAGLPIVDSNGRLSANEG